MIKVGENYIRADSLGFIFIRLFTTKSTNNKYYMTLSLCQEQSKHLPTLSHWIFSEVGTIIVLILHLRKLRNGVLM